MNIPEHPTLLGLDTAGSSCSVAVMKNGEVVATLLEEMRRGQSERLLPLIHDVLDDAGLELMDMDGFAVTTGPGGFTGVRIGLAAAQGFALACGKPLVGVSNFEVMARAVPDCEKDSDQVLAVLIDAKRADIFVQCFSTDLSALTEPFSIAPEKMASQLPEGSLLLLGDGVDQVVSALSEAGRKIVVSKVNPSVDAQYLLNIAIERKLFTHDQGRISPLYLRAPDVSLPKPKPPVR
ncbi:tRNA (adenosine(37)-N6)-threonylcarbamoyltransferase complex dimerization subunit type 1 TsaB [Kiloniella antarctica]|uniref:tRNA (Adenosine(37)-N6)-threonylcarbamoyltransferase complex dimerization subunit type 1 TsaB n=1 Tax=Kiloniella antarctica TaxID=1550907 RepID=A0ABW5BIP2_9PROT